MAKKNKPQLRVVARSTPASGTPAPPITVSPRWLLGAIGITLLAAIVCAWASLCLLFWQGSWQLLYHPSSKMTRTPASAGLAFDPIRFAATDTGQLRLQGWWLPAAPASRFTVLYLHGQNGNLGDAVNTLAQVHAAGVNVFAFDYRGYGSSVFERPSEARWRQDTNWAMEYLTGTRHIDAHSIVVMGDALGANLALEVAAAHPELAGVVLDAPMAAPMSVIFGDPRANLIPARLLDSDRYDLDSAATAVRVPSLWIMPGAVVGAYQKVSAPHTMAHGEEITAALRMWLSGLKQ